MCWCCCKCFALMGWWHVRAGSEGVPPCRIDGKETNQVTFIGQIIQMSECPAPPPSGPLLCDIAYNRPAVSALTTS